MKLEPNMKSHFQYLWLLTAIVAGSATSNAQQPASLTAARVTLIASGATSRGGRTEVIRQAHRQPQNVVMVDRNASADDLAAALAIVNGLRAQHGDLLANDYRARPERVKHGARPGGSEYQKWLNEQLVRLRKAPERELQPFGVVQAVQITLPAPIGTVASPGGND
jgi:hypothetical protein